MNERAAIGWLIFAAYVVGYVMTWRRAAWVVAEDFKGYGRERPGGDDVAMAMFIGAFIAFAWPLIAPGYILWRRGVAVDGAWAFLKPPKHVRQRAELAAREAAVTERERRIRQLEREVGVA